MRKRILLILVMSLLIGGCSIANFGKARIIGQVTDFYSGAPMANAVVYINDVSYSCDENGEFETDYIRQGNVVIECVALGYAPEERTVYVVNDPTVVNFALKASGTVTWGDLDGVITDDETEEVIKDAVVKLMTGTEVYVADFTDNNGKYLLRNLPAGSYGLVVSKEGYNTETKNVSIEPGSQTVNVQLKKKAD